MSIVKLCEEKEKKNIETIDALLKDNGLNYSGAEIYKNMQDQLKGIYANLIHFDGEAYYKKKMELSDICVVNILTDYDLW